MRTCANAPSQQLPLEALLTLLDLEDVGKQCPILAQRLLAYAKFCKGHLSGAQAPSLLAKAISDLLRVIGFPASVSSIPPNIRL